MARPYTRYRPNSPISFCAFYLIYRIVIRPRSVGFPKAGVRQLFHYRLRFRPPSGAPFSEMTALSVPHAFSPPSFIFVSFVCAVPSRNALIYARDGQQARSFSHASSLKISMLTFDICLRLLVATRSSLPAKHNARYTFFTDFRFIMTGIIMCALF